MTPDRTQLPRLLRMKTAADLAQLSIRHFYREWYKRGGKKITIRNSDFVDRELLLNFIEVRRASKQEQSTA